MNKKTVVLAAFILAFWCALISNGTEAVGNMVFNLHLVPRGADERRISAAIHQYNSASAGIYLSGGLKDELNIIPALQLQKRRLFQDVNLLKGDGIVMVFDRDEEKVTRVTFVNPQFALAESEENWAVALKSATTFAPSSNVKGCRVRVRYQMRRARGQWVVDAAEVFPRNETIPEPNVAPVL
jgi:hypothetical protein